MDYKIIASPRIAEFTEIVNNNLAKGWQLQGGLAVSVVGFCQAMVKPEVISDPLNSFNVVWETRDGLQELGTAVDQKLTGTTPHVQNEKPKRSHKKKT